VIDGETHILGLVGYPIAHSLSPFFQNYLLSRAGLNTRYVPFPVRPGADVAAALRGLALAGVQGVNVTVPHKVAAAAACDSLSEEAQAAGAVNTITMARDGRLAGHNTDVMGFLAPLLDRGVDLAGRDALVLGAGGAARAVAVGLARAGAAVTVAARRRAEADLVAAAVEAATDGHLAACDWEERSNAVARASLVVNATPVGRAPRAEECPLDDEAPLSADHVVYDIVYTPLETRLLRRAREAGAVTFDGLDMLARQGIASLETWLGIETLGRFAGDVRRRCEEELARRDGR